MKTEIEKPIEEGKNQLHIIVEGRVQGVGFRAFTQRKAISLGITGWVRNRWNGTVEVLAEGNKNELEQFTNVLQRGPYPGTTRKLIKDIKQAEERFSSFQIRMTG